MEKENELPPEEIEEEAAEATIDRKTESKHIPLSVGPDGNVIPKHLADTERRFNQEHGL